MNLERNFKASTDEKLMEYVAKGERKAFEELYARYNRKLFSYLYRLLDRNREKAQDFLQDVFMKIIERPDQFDTTRKFSTWVYTIATNLCRNEMRNMATQSRLLDASGMKNDYVQHVTYSSELDHKQFREELQEVYRGLNERDRAVFVLKFQHEMPLKDIAEILDCPEGTVKSATYYLLKKIAQKLPHFKPE